MRPHNKRFNGAPKRKKSRAGSGPMTALKEIPTFKQDSVGATSIPFGPHKNIPLRYVPSTYLLWLLSQEWFRDRYQRLTDQISAFTAKQRGRRR